MKKAAILVGHEYKSRQGVIRRVENIVGNTVHWVKLEGHARSPDSGSDPIDKFAWWAIEDIGETKTEPEIKDDDDTFFDFIDTASIVDKEPDVKPNDLVCAFTVVLSKEIRHKDIEAVSNAILQLKGVASVVPVRADMQYFIAKDAVKRELLQQLKDVLTPKIG